MVEQEKRESVREIIKKHQLPFFLIISIVPSVLFEILFIFIGLYELLFAIPLVIFIGIHYTGIWGFKNRLKYGFAIIIVLLFAMVLIMTPITYQSPGILKFQTSGDSSIEMDISPYNGYSQTHLIYANFSGLNKNTTYKPVIIIIGASSLSNVSYYVMKNTTAPEGYLNVSHTFNNIPEGQFFVVVNLNTTKGNITTGFIKGPINSNIYSYGTYLLYSYSFLFILLLGIIYIAGLLVARSLSNSAAYRREHMHN
ncbi:hypothetical protein ACNF42_04490 [Cuniculiplasma sp. SKW3]|uniref:hypothetical protein n=1 Tax=Cuniculiplasma sp. SKW3 TaxID=3400170 RepID=UPI003FCF0614